MILLLATQGVAVASASPQMAMSQAGASVMPPCHGMAMAVGMDMGAMKTMAPIQKTSHGKSSCCDVSCPDMTSCALSAAALPSSMPFALPVAVASAISSDAHFQPPAPPGSHLRPPISLPA